jgi:cytochrome c-type biogenesis protein CcmE
VWLALAILAVVTLAFAVLNRREPPIDALDVDHVFEHPERLAGGRIVRIDGFLVPGSCIGYQSPCEWRFQIRGSQRVLNVRYPRCAIPSTEDFDPDVNVTVVGFLAPDATEVVATAVMSKSPSGYRVPPIPRTPICPGPHVPPSPTSSSPPPP